MNRTVLTDIVSSLFICLFLYTGISKLMDIERFKWAVSRSPLLHDFSTVIGYTIPILEISIAIVLLISLFRPVPNLQRWGMLSSAVMMCLFALYVGYMVYFRADRPCTCGGIISKLNWHQHFYFNSVLSCIAIFTIIYRKRVES